MGSGARRSPQQLPARHSYSRSFVVRNQRERMLAAVGACCARSGYHAMSVEDVVGAAGVSRRTFYEQFRNKADAFLAAYREMARRLLAAVEQEVEAEGTFADRLRAGLGAFLEVIGGEPALAKMCLVDVLGAGAEALRERDDTMRRFAELIRRHAPPPPPGTLPPELLTEMVVGGIYECIYARVLRGEAATLPALWPDIAYAALVPYVGHAEAATQRERALADRRRQGL